MYLLGPKKLLSRQVLRHIPAEKETIQRPAKNYLAWLHLWTGSVSLHGTRELLEAAENHNMFQGLSWLLYRDLPERKREFEAERTNEWMNLQLRSITWQSKS